MAASPVVFEQQRDKVRVLSFDPGEGGVMRIGTAAQLLSAFESAFDDASVRVIVLTGAQDKVFVRHYCVEEILRSAAAVREDGSLLESAATSPVARLFSACANSPKPIIAAINGICMGGGFELALCCSRRVVQSGVTQLGLPETRIGLFPGGGGTQRLPRLLGEARALQFIMDGSVVDATGALRLGLVDDLAEDALQHAIEIAQRWAQHSPALLTAILQLVRGTNARPLAEGIEREARAFLQLVCDDEDALKRMQRFLDSGIGLGDYIE